MKPSPPWISLLAVVVQVAGLGLCVWAMESSMKRGNVLTGGTAVPDAPDNAPPPPWSPGAPPPAGA